jgi:hypothetical protein
MRGAQLHVQPAIDQFLQACLAAKMLRRGVMRQHVFPGVDLQHLAFRRLSMGAKGLVPGEPPMVYRAFLLAADVAIKSLGPGQRRHPILRLDFPHEGSLHPWSGATSHFLSGNSPKFPYFIGGEACVSLLHRSLSFAQPSTGVPQTFCNSFTIQQQS